METRNTGPADGVENKNNPLDDSSDNLKPTLFFIDDNKITNKIMDKQYKDLQLTPSKLLGTLADLFKTSELPPFEIVTIQAENGAYDLFRQLKTHKRLPNHINRLTGSDHKKDLLNKCTTIIVSDYEMPKMKGTQFLAHWRFLEYYEELKKLENSFTKDEIEAYASADKQILNRIFTEKEQLYRNNKHLFKALLSLNFQPVADSSSDEETEIFLNNTNTLVNTDGKTSDELRDMLKENFIQLKELVELAIDFFTIKQIPLLYFPLVISSEASLADVEKGLKEVGLNLLEDNLFVAVKGNRREEIKRDYNALTRSISQDAIESFNLRRSFSGSGSSSLYSRRKRSVSAIENKTHSLSLEDENNNNSDIPRTDPQPRRNVL